MAIKTQQPQSAKTTSKTFDSKDIEALKTHQNKTDQLIIQLGQISLQKHQLEESEKNLKQEINKLKEEEQKMASEFTSKYGKGTLDLNSGNFTPQD